jgi:hypothetical protein
MIWNKEGAQYQATRKGTSRAHELYFITTIGAYNKNWRVGYRGYGRLIDMDSVGQFATAQLAREFIADYDNKVTIIESVI